METFDIPYNEIKIFSTLISDYINKKETLSPFISHFPELNNFEKQIKEKQKCFINRKLLVECISEQNSFLNLSKSSAENIKMLQSSSTFSITTGHQLCLFGGPLYVFYKIISTINLTEELNKRFSTKKFVPIFWLASEDHDFEEINHIHLFGKKVKWSSSQTGPVGKMHLNNIQSTLNQISKLISGSKNAKFIMDFLNKSYLENENLTNATRFFLNELFGEYGLVIIDGDDKKLKQEIIFLIKQDLNTNKLYEKINQSTSKLRALDYKPQAFVQKFNFFRLTKGSRTKISEEININEIENNPHLFSPNVLLRPLYQEYILPNIGYVGGSSEIAYWLQLKSMFKHTNVTFPLLFLRNSALIISQKQKQKLDSFNLTFLDLFEDESFMQRKIIQDQYENNISFIFEEKEIKKIYNSLINKTTDDGIKKHITSELVKQLKVIKNIEKKILRSLKEKESVNMQQISKLKNQLFPNNNLQERHNNFIQFYLKYGDNFIKILKDSLNPLNTNFVVLSK